MTFPQRIAHYSPPGSLLKSAERATPHKDASNHVDAAYLVRVRSLPCLCCGLIPSEAAHMRMASAAYGKASGLGKKPADRHSLPLCAGCHRLNRDAQHNRGEKEFWDSIDINPLMVCEQLYAVRNDQVAMENVIRVAISQRRK